MVLPVIGVGSTRRSHRIYGRATARNLPVCTCGHGSLGTMGMEGQMDLLKFPIPNSQFLTSRRQAQREQAQFQSWLWFLQSGGPLPCVGSAGRNRATAPAVFYTVVNSRQVSLNEVWTEASLR
jgi:hypothetical protein